MQRLTSKRFQSTFPRGERPAPSDIRLKENIISIHVPAWGTTSCYRQGCWISSISIHVPAWGTTGICGAAAYCGTISIHVPAWGTTFIGRNLKVLVMISIHVPAWGTTETRHCIYLSMPYFNPRSRVGNDKFAIIVCVCIIISIHVPAWGTTYTVCYIFKCFTISIHVPAWGTTGRLLPDGQQTAISIHVPAWGTTANFHKYSLLFYAINIIFLLFIIPSLFSLVLFVLLF